MESANMSPADAHCYVCSKNGKTMKRCTKCKKVLYCSRSCQIQDWPSHKPLCTKESDMIDNRTKTIEVPNKDLQNVSLQEKESKTAVDIEEADTNQSIVEGRHSQITDKTDFKRNFVSLTIKCLKKRHKLVVDTTLGGESLIAHIASSVHIPKGKLKLVCKGKLMTADNIGLFAKDKSVLQAIGEVAENEDDLESGHIDCIMTRVGVERNEAVRALRETGDVVDAILYLGNK